MQAGVNDCKNTRSTPDPQHKPAAQLPHTTKMMLFKFVVTLLAVFSSAAEAAHAPRQADVLSTVGALPGQFITKLGPCFHKDSTAYLQCVHQQTVGVCV